MAADAFGPLSASRLRHELVLVLEDQQVELSLLRLEELGFLPVLGRTTSLSERDWVSLRSVLNLQEDWDAERFQDLDPRWWLVELMSLALGEPEAKRVTLAQRLGLDEHLSEILVRFPETLRWVSSELETADLAPHVVCRILDDLQAEELVLLLATGQESITDWIHRWMKELRSIRLTIDGTDLKRQGFAGSPEMGKVLQSTLEARLDGVIEATEELEFAVRQLRKDTE
jgi:hypothetical protein